MQAFDNFNWLHLQFMKWIIGEWAETLLDSLVTESGRNIQCLKHIVNNVQTLHAITHTSLARLRGSAKKLYNHKLTMQHHQQESQLQPINNSHSNKAKETNHSQGWLQSHWRSSANKKSQEIFFQKAATRWVRDDDIEFDSCSDVNLHRIQFIGATISGPDYDVASWSAEDH